MIGLLALAEAMEVVVEYEDYLPDGWVGAFSLTSMVVYLLKGLPSFKARTVLAHELGHAHYQHTGRSTADEWKADKFAAHRLIPREDYEAVTRRTGGNVEESARILGVTPHLLSVAARSYRAPSFYQGGEGLKVSSGLVLPPIDPHRRLEPRRLTQAMPIVRPGMSLGGPRHLARV